MYEIFEERGVEDGGGLEFLSSDGGSDDGEDARADDGTNAERSEAQPAKRLLKAKLGAFAIGNELVNILATEER